jgi:hypothetical protein
VVINVCLCINNRVVSFSRKRELCIQFALWDVLRKGKLVAFIFIPVMAADDGSKNCPCNADRLIGSSCSYQQWRKKKKVLDKRCCVILTLREMTSEAKVIASVGPGDMALYFVITS